MHLVLIIKPGSVKFRTSDGRSGSEPHKHDLVQVADAVYRIKAAIGFASIAGADTEETIWDV